MWGAARARATFFFTKLGEAGDADSGGSAQPVTLFVWRGFAKGDVEGRDFSVSFGAVFEWEKTLGLLNTAFVFWCCSDCSVSFGVVFG